MLRDYCSCRSKSVEILYENPSKKKILTKVYFQLEPDSDLREVIVEKVKWQINRDSAEHKLRDFLMWMKPVKRDTLHHRWLNHHPLTKYLFNYPTQRYWLLLFITLLLNLFLLLTFSVPEDRRNDATNATWPDAAGSFKPDVQNYFRSFLLFVLGGFHLLLALWMVAEYFVVNYPHFFLLVPSFISKAKDRSVNKSENSWLEKYFYKFLASNMAQYIICRLTKRKKTPIAINIYGLSTLYVVLFLLASILSLGFHGYFYPICLLYIIVNNDILQRVLRAVTKNGVSLLWVAALGGVVLFIYAVIVFAFLHESAKDKGEKPFYCDNLGTCFISVIRWGLLENLGLAIPHIPQQFETSGLRILFDVSFFIIVTTIGLNIVFGIIVDTFTELRDERYRTEEDMKSKCFICDIERHEFEHEEDGFKLHVERDHNMWAYIYYSMYLDGIDTNAHSAIEKFVFDKIKDKKFDYFPVNKAKCLEKKEEDETKKQLAELNEKVTLVLSRFEKQEHEQMRLTKQQEQDEWNKNAIKRRQSSLVSGASVDEPALASRSPTDGD
jgi:inositol 1,4,5-triphosphate receptor type 1